LKKELVSIQVNGTSPNLTPKNWDIVRPAKIKIYLMAYVLVVPNTSVW
jgi:hypothetical protein